LHPQVVIERDKVLRALGPSTIPEREQWLDRVGALKDEWIIERKIQLLIDEVNLQKRKIFSCLRPFKKFIKLIRAPDFGSRSRIN
jgi:hypothetical protein